jgi:hypothetical protein
MARQLGYHAVSFGADPEFFFERSGLIVGSEKIIPATGMTVGSSRLVRDGVQAELNPRPETCRALFANEFARCFRGLVDIVNKDKTLGINLSSCVTITQEELDSLSEEAKKFGCAPSMNTDATAKPAATVTNPEKYLYRPAGGHIHLGAIENCTTGKALRMPDRTVPILDLFCANLAVLVDRDPSNIERRKLYGRAGEYRLPKHGLEYRTLSNFWLRAYPLMSWMLGMARFSVSVVANDLEWGTFEKEIQSMIDFEHVRQAINTNDADLAWENYLKIKPFIADAASSTWSMHKENLDDFEFFVKQGLDFWWGPDHDPLKHWANLPDGHDGGWESFLSKKVRPVRLKPELEKRKREEAERKRIAAEEAKRVEEARRAEEMVRAAAQAVERKKKAEEIVAAAMAMVNPDKKGRKKGKPIVPLEIKYFEPPLGT